MSKLLVCAFVLALSVILACSREAPDPTSVPAPTQAPAPTATVAPTATPIPPTATPVPTPEPTATPKPTATPEPTAMPAPTATTAPTQETTKPDSGSGVIAPFNMDDPLALMSQLSPDELSCILQNADPQVLQKLMSAPDSATPEEAEGLITCLEDETLLSFFLSPFTSQTGALSEETSACLRGGFEGLDLRALILGSYAAPDEEAAMISGMTGFIVTLACLNEEEWEMASPALELGPYNPEGLQCVLDKLGGPEGLAAMTSPDAGPPIALFGAAIECNLAFVEGPPPGPEPTAAPAPTATSVPAPTATAAPIAKPAEPDSGAGVIAPLNMQDPQALMSALAPDELSCILQSADPQVLQKLMSAPDTATPEEAEGFINCLEDETLLTFFLVPFTSQTGALGEETSACLRIGFEGIDLRAMMLGSFASPDDEAAQISGLTGFIVTASCLNEEEWELASPALELGPYNPEGLECVLDKVGGPEGLAAMSRPDAGPPIALFGAAAECNLAFMQPPPS